MMHYPQQTHCVPLTSFFPGKKVKFAKPGTAKTDRVVSQVAHFEDFIFYLRVGDGDKKIDQKNLEK